MAFNQWLLLTDSSSSSIETTNNTRSSGPDVTEESPLLPTDEPFSPAQEEFSDEPVAPALDLEEGGGDNEDVPPEVGDPKVGEDGKAEGEAGGVRLTFANAVEMECEIHKKMLQHTLAHEHFANLNFALFTVPQALFTAVTSVLAFAGGTKVFANYTQELSLIVGSLSSAVVLIQTIGGVKGYAIRSDRHNTAAIQLRTLYDELGIGALKLKEIERLKNDNTKEFDAKKDNPNPMTFAQFEKQYKSCLEACNSLLPTRIKEAFHGLDTNIEMMQTAENKALAAEWFGDGWDHHTAFKSKAYDIMAGEIVNSNGFPYFLPNTCELVKKTMGRLRMRVKQGKEFYKDLDKLEVPPFGTTGDEKRSFC